MTTNVNFKRFFCFGIENVKGETFHGIKEAVLATNVATDVVKFYNGIGFNKVVATNCNDSIFVKDSNDRLLAFVTDEVNLKADGSKEYRTAYWAWNEVKRQAQIVAEKAAAAAKASAKVNAKVTKDEGREVATDKKKNALMLLSSLEAGKISVHSKKHTLSIWHMLTNKPEQAVSAPDHRGASNKYRNNISNKSYLSKIN